MPNVLASYASEDVSSLLGGVLLTGGADGTFVSAKRRSDVVTLEVGSDGSPAVYVSPDKSGTIELTFLQTSPANDILSAELASIELTKRPGKPLIIKDKNGTTVISCDRAWPMNYPETVFSKGIEARKWTLETGRMIVVVGGNL